MAVSATIQRINSKSPYKVIQTGSGLSSVTLKVWIYDGTQGASVGSGVDGAASSSNDRPSSPTYTLKSDAVGASSSRYVSFEVSSLLDGYIKQCFNGTHNSSREGAVMFMDYQVHSTFSSSPVISAMVQAVAYDGYTYFEEGLNYQDNATGMFTSNTLLKKEDESVNVPINTRRGNLVSFLKDGTTVSTSSISTSNEADEQISYASSTLGGVFDFNQIRIQNTDGDIRNINVVSVCANKYPSYKVTFVNKYGALEDILFYGNSTESLSVKSNTFNVNTTNYLTGGYDTCEAQTHKQGVSSKKMMTLNSGFHPEDCNEAFKELIQSTDVWINYNGQTLPIVVKSSSFNVKTELNDNAINYTINIEFAFNRINNI